MKNNYLPLILAVGISVGLSYFLFVKKGLAQPESQPEPQQGIKPGQVVDYPMPDGWIDPRSISEIDFNEYWF